MRRMKKYCDTDIIQERNNTICVVLTGKTPVTRLSLRRLLQSFHTKML